MIIYFSVKDDNQEEITEKQEEIDNVMPVDVIKTAQIYPEAAYSNNHLNVKFDIDSRMVLPRFRYTWRRNGLLIRSVSGNTLDPEYFNKGDEVSVEIEEADSLLKESFRPPAVKILNTPPKIIEASLSMETASSSWPQVAT